MPKGMYGKKMAYPGTGPKDYGYEADGGGSSNAYSGSYKGKKMSNYDDGGMGGTGYKKKKRKSYKGKNLGQKGEMRY